MPPEKVALLKILMFFNAQITYAQMCYESKYIVFTNYCHNTGTRRFLGGSRLSCTISSLAPKWEAIVTCLLLSWGTTLYSI